MAVSGRTRWLAMIEGHWDHFIRAGWVQKVEYRSYDAGLDAAAASGSGVKRVDAVCRGEVKREVPTPDGGRAFEITRRIHLRVSQMRGTVATKRGIIELADGSEYVIESVEVAAEATRYACDTVKR